ncbi:MAG: hypothetical protein JNL04_18085 [Rhodospirillaceae bacterium]|nr:hypothetical protein [Rhodospirillaceae bacterium]
MQGAGFIAIWSDLTPEDETDWAHWMMREHAVERLGVDGFLACRVFRALGGSANRYLILYELETADAVGGPSYIARLNAPTPWSQRIMPRLENFGRGGGRVAASAGIGQGGILAALPLEVEPDWDREAICRDLASQYRIAAARVLLTDLAQTSIQTREKSLRRVDGSFAGLLLVEGLDEASVRNALGHLGGMIAHIDAPLYALRFNLDRRLLRR